MLSTQRSPPACCQSDHQACPASATSGPVASLRTSHGQRPASQPPEPIPTISVTIHKTRLKRLTPSNTTSADTTFTGRNPAPSAAKAALPPTNTAITNKTMKATQSPDCTRPSASLTPDVSPRKLARAAICCIAVGSRAARKQAARSSNCPHCVSFRRSASHSQESFKTIGFCINVGCLGSGIKLG